MAATDSKVLGNWARIAVLSVLTSSHAYAGEPWDATDRLLGTATFTTMDVDWRQTRYIAKHPEHFYETNPFLGSNPSVSRVDNYYLVIGAGTFMIADHLSGKDRKWFLGAVLAFEFAYALHNKRIGVKLDF